MKAKTIYWINTLGTQRVNFVVNNFDFIPPAGLVAMYGVKKCNWITYYLFIKTKVNLLAEDKFKWLRNSETGSLPVVYAVLNTLLRLTQTVVGTVISFYTFLSRKQN